MHSSKPSDRIRKPHGACNTRRNSSDNRECNVALPPLETSTQVDHSQHLLAGCAGGQSPASDDGGGGIALCLSSLAAVVAELDDDEVERRPDHVAADRQAAQRPNQNRGRLKGTYCCVERRRKRAAGRSAPECSTALLCTAQPAEYTIGLCAGQRGRMRRPAGNSQQRFSGVRSSL